VVAAVHRAAAVVQASLSSARYWQLLIKRAQVFREALKSQGQANPISSM
jgi:hypothetical protein